MIMLIGVLLIGVVLDTVSVSCVSILFAVICIIVLFSWYGLFALYVAVIVVVWLFVVGYCL